MTGAWVKQGLYTQGSDLYVPHGREFLSNLPAAFTADTPYMGMSQD